MFVIYDANNWFRRKAETSLKTSPIRECFYEIQNNPHNCVLVWDGPGALKARREIFPDYKVKRNKPNDSFFENQKVFKQLLDLGRGIQIEIPGMEADDIIAMIVKRAINEGTPPHQIFINSNDSDFAVLGVGMARDKFPVKPQYVPIYKTMVGDSGDNIPGCKGFGKKGWEDLNDDQRDMLIDIVINHKPEDHSPDMIVMRCEGLMSKSSLSWFSQIENRKQLAKFYQIISFLPVSIEEIDKHTRKGANRPDLVEPILKQMMMI